MKLLPAWILISLATLLFRAGGAQLAVPNSSFESPGTTFVFIGIDAWQKTAKPPSYDESGGFFWVQLTGLFSNTPPGSADHIVNCHSNQAAWLFAVPEVGLFQDFDSIGSTVTNPSRAFNAVYRPDHAYRLTVGVIGAGGGMPLGMPLELGLYYRDNASNRVMVATTTVTNSEIFAARTNFFDFSVRVPPVAAGSAWAGRNIGIQFLSGATATNEGGYWALDNVRLEEFPPPQLTNLALAGGNFQFTLLSEPGLGMRILSTTNAALAVSNWPVVLTVTNVSGTTNLSVPVTNAAVGVFRARQTP